MFGQVQSEKCLAKISVWPLLKDSNVTGQLHANGRKKRMMNTSFSMCEKNVCAYVKSIC